MTKRLGKIMKYIILGMVGIPVGGFLISAIYHYWITGTCIMKPDLSGIKLMYYVGDGLRRNVGTSP